jgi:GntR family transcriptional repressor for pyruvate dehydrogenase complex
MKTMTKSLPEGWITSLHIPGRVEKTLGEHSSILDAIRGGDPERAEEMMTLHLTNALKDIQASMER